jgi:hypothetical protein
MIRNQKTPRIKTSGINWKKGLCDDDSPSDWAYATETNGNMKITPLKVNGTSFVSISQLKDK